MKCHNLTYVVYETLHMYMHVYSSSYTVYCTTEGCVYAWPSAMLHAAAADPLQTLTVVGKIQVCPAVHSQRPGIQ